MKFVLILTLLFSVLAIEASTVSMSASTANRKITISSRDLKSVVALFRDLSQILAPSTSTTASVDCGYIFPNDPNKFGCKGVGPAAAGDVAAACAGGGQLGCTGSGSNRVCVCAFD